MKLVLATATAVLAIPIIEGFNIGSVMDIDNVYKQSPSFVSVPESASKSFFRRELQMLTDECEEETKITVLADSVYNETVDANEFACPDSSVGWLDASGVVNQISDFRTCDQSELKAYCEAANYQMIEVPDHNLKCEENALNDRPYAYDFYFYDQILCLAKESCPSDATGWTPQDILKLYKGADLCSAEFLEEGHQPPQEPDLPVDLDNISQECVDEVELIFDSAEYKNASDIDGEDVGEDCELCYDRYMSGSDSITLCDYNACGKQVSEFYSAMDALGYQAVTFTNMKVTCPGNIFIYLYSTMHVTGPSCPSDASEYTGKDLLAIVGGFDSCVAEALEEGDEPPPPPSTEPPAEPSPTTDAPVPPAAEASSGAASERCPTWAIALLPAVATTLASFLVG
jgi:hypothetical protein